MVRIMECGRVLKFSTSGVASSTRQSGRIAASWNIKRSNMLRGQLRGLAVLLVPLRLWNQDQL